MSRALVRLCVAIKNMFLGGVAIFGPKKIGKKFIWSICLSGIFYLTLVCFDILLPRLDSFNHTQREVRNKLFNQGELSKKLETSLKTENPYMKRILLPVSFEYYPLRTIVKRHGFIPLGALPNSYTFLSSEGAGLPSYKSDRFGFRNKDKIWDMLEDLDLVVLGDSFVGGNGLLTGETITDNLNDKGIIALNLGLAGFSAVHYQFLSKIFLPMIKPKKVLVVFYGNDNHLSEEIHGSYLNEAKIEKYIMKDKRGILGRSREVDAFFDEVSAVLNDKKASEGYWLSNNYLKLKKYFVLSNTKKLFMNFIFPNRIPPSNEEAIRELVKLCESLACNVYFALIQPSDYWDPDSSFKLYQTGFERFLIKLGEFNLIKSSSVIDQNDLSNWGTGGGHFSKKGAKIFSDHIIEKIYQ